MSDYELEDKVEILIHVGFDPFMRNISVNVHSDKTLTPKQFLEELAELVAEYQDFPELLFEDEAGDVTGSQ